MRLFLLILPPVNSSNRQLSFKIIINFDFKCEITSLLSHSKPVMDRFSPVFCILCVSFFFLDLVKTTNKMKVNVMETLITNHLPKYLYCLFAICLTLNTFDIPVIQLINNTFMLLFIFLFQGLEHLKLLEKLNLYPLTI